MFIMAWSMLPLPIVCLWGVTRTPSLSAMIVNHFKMRDDLISYNLAGMGCSAGVIAIGLAERLLRNEPGKYALVVSTENVTQVRVLPFEVVRR